MTSTTKRTNEEDCEAFDLAFPSSVSAGPGHVDFDVHVGWSAKSTCTGHRNYGEEVRVLDLTGSREDRDQSSTQDHGYRPRSWFQNWGCSRWLCTEWRTRANFYFG